MVVDVLDIYIQVSIAHLQSSAIKFEYFVSKGGGSNVTQSLLWWCLNEALKGISVIGSLGLYMIVNFKGQKRNFFDTFKPQIEGQL